MRPSKEIVPANDDHNVVDLLISAHGISRDEVTKHFIELALLHEGRKISRTLSLDSQYGLLNGTGA